MVLKAFDCRLFPIKVIGRTVSFNITTERKQLQFTT
jgi:hypothetical protein